VADKIFENETSAYHCKKISFAQNNCFIIACNTLVHYYSSAADFARVGPAAGKLAGSNLL
jgi:hypothetical protein